MRRQALSGDLGTSLVTGEPITEVIQARLPVHAASWPGSHSSSPILVAVPLGVVMAALTHGGRRRSLELGFTTTAGTFASIPSFLLAVGLVWLFAVNLGVLPVAGRGGPSSYVLPVAALAIAPAFALSRIVRVEGLRVLDQDYMRTARGKRLPPQARIPPPRAAEHAHGDADDRRPAARRPSSPAPSSSRTSSRGRAWGRRSSSPWRRRTTRPCRAVALLFGTLVLLINFAVDIALGVIDPRSTILET